MAWQETTVSYWTVCWKWGFIPYCGAHLHLLEAGASVGPIGRFKVAFTLSSLLLAACGQDLVEPAGKPKSPATTLTGVGVESGHRAEINRFSITNLQAAGPLRPGTPIEVVYTVHANIPTKDAEITFTLPEIEAAKLSAFGPGYSLPVGQRLPSHATHGYSEAINLTCAYSEGFADYHGAVTREDSAAFTTATRLGTFVADGSIVEGSVAAFFYDLTDAANDESFDQVMLGGPYLADVMRNCRVRHEGWTVFVTPVRIDELIACLEQRTDIYGPYFPTASPEVQEVRVSGIIAQNPSGIRTLWLKNLFNDASAPPPPPPEEPPPCEPVPPQITCEGGG